MFTQTVDNNRLKTAINNSPLGVSELDYLLRAQY